MIEQLLDEKLLLPPIEILDFQNIQVLQYQDHSMMIVNVETIEENQYQDLVDAQFDINKKLRNLGYHGILVDIISYQILFDKKLILCKVLKLDNKKENQNENIAMANCLELYIGMKLIGVREQVIMNIAELETNKILPFTYLNKVIPEFNSNLILYEDKLLKFRDLETIDPQDLQLYFWLNYNQGIRIKSQELNSLDKILELQNPAILENFNIYKLQARQVVFLQLGKQEDLRNKIIQIDKPNTSQENLLIFCGLKTILKLLNIGIQSVIQKDCLLLKTLYKPDCIAVSQIEIHHYMREEEYFLILDECNSNPTVRIQIYQIDLLNLEGSQVKDSLIHRLVQGSRIKIKEVSLKQCQNITDDGIDVLGNLQVNRLDVSYTKVQYSIPQNLKHLNIAYCNFDEETLIQIFQSRILINIISLDISGLCTDNIFYQLMANSYKDLRNLICNDGDLSTDVLRYLSESKYVKTLDHLSLRNSIKRDTQEGLFRKSNYNIFGHSQCAITKLDLSECVINDKLIQYLVEGQRVLSNLKYLSLSGCAGITDKSIFVLCDASPNINGKIKSLDISNLNITEHSLECLSLKQLPSLSDLNISKSQIKSQDLKKILDHGKFNHLKYLALSEKQGDALQFNIPEICACFVKNNLSELQSIEIFIEKENLSNILNLLQNLLLTNLLIKVTAQSDIIIDDDSLSLLLSKKGHERLIINNKPLPRVQRQQITKEYTKSQYYEILKKKQCSVKFGQGDIKYLQFLRHFQNLAIIILNKTDIVDNDIECISNLNWVQQISIKKCKHLSIQSLNHMLKLKDNLINLDIRQTLFDKSYEALMILSNFQRLIHFNNGKIDVQIKNQGLDKNLARDLQNLPKLWLKLNIVESFQLEISAKNIITFKFIFSNLSLLINKNQDQLVKLRISLQTFNSVSLKHFQLFNNSVMFLRNLQSFTFQMRNMKQISLQILQNLILSLQNLENLKDLNIDIRNCHFSQTDQEVFDAQTTFEGIRNLRLNQFRFVADDLEIEDDPAFEILFSQIIEIDSLKILNLSFARHNIQEQCMRQLFNSVQNLQLEELYLNFEQSCNKLLSRETWSMFLECLRNNNLLTNLEINFNHIFNFIEIDVENLISLIDCLRLQNCNVSLIGCLNSVDSIQMERFTKEYNIFV